ncbi:MAG: 1-acyl-sn-glycerol-3-phosphate acyltransferase [Prochloron sp. SP5CPC1]|nr:1-acyl-sn-glycerol-3-phosphate acyltransferase [Candidatus Paraprochloron terpiosi SP5CPC1]
MIPLANNSKTSQPTSNFSEIYRISPWLIAPLYPMAKYALLPLYFGSIQITGREKIPTTGPVIIAPTHRSRWDAIIVSLAMGRLVSGRDLRFMVSADEMKGFQGWLVKRLGGFPVDLEHLGISSFRYSVQLLTQGEMLVIFPEGGIYRDRAVHSLKEGLARIALSVQSQEIDVKILPVSINYSQPYPTWGTDICLDIGSPLNLADYSSGSGKKRAKQLTGDLKKTLSKLSQL